MTHEEKIELDIRRIIGSCESTKIHELINLVLRYEETAIMVSLKVSQYPLPDDPQFKIT